MAQTHDGVYLDKWRFDDAERAYQEHLSQLRSGTCNGVDNTCRSSPCKTTCTKSTLVSEIARAREHIQKSLTGCDTGAPCADTACLARVAKLEQEQEKLRKTVAELQESVRQLTLQAGGKAPAAAPVKTETKGDDDDDFELFGSDEEEEEESAEAKRVREERLKAYEAKKSKKEVLIAKSNIILDVKPWDDETDMAELEKCVRSIEMDGLLWGASKFVPVGYGIKKLQISCVVEDDKVSTDDLEEKICAFEDFVQSMDIAAFNKV